MRPSQAAQSPPAIRLVNEVIRAGIVAGASEILFEAGRGLDVVRFRVEGELREHAPIPADTMPFLLRRMAVLSKLAPILPAEVQEGTALVQVKGVRYELGITITPITGGRTLSAVIHPIDDEPVS